jgi:hypothetical protein
MNDLGSKKEDRALHILRIANEAVAEAIAENKRYGIPEFFWKAGRMYYVLPDGTLTTEQPEVLREAQARLMR